MPPPIDNPIPQGIAQLDPTFLCADVPDPTATHVTLEGLQTREPNMVMLLAVDAAGNASATYFTSYLVMSSKDWWVDLSDRGDRVDGGFGCDAGGGGAGALVALAVVLASRRPRGGSAAMVPAWSNRRRCSRRSVTGSPRCLPR